MKRRTQGAGDVRKPVTVVPDAVTAAGTRDSTSQVSEPRIVAGRDVPPALAEPALATLMELMVASASDQVRVAAAKIILAHALEQEEQKMRKPKPSNDGERRAAIDAIARLLDELAAAKAAGPASAVAVVADGAVGAGDAAG